MALNGTNGCRIGRYLDRLLPECLTDMVINYLSTPINLWDQKRYTTMTFNSFVITKLADLPITGNIVSFYWNPVGINATEFCGSFASIAGKLYPKEMKQVRIDVPAGGHYYQTYHERFLDHPIIQKIEKEGKIRETYRLIVQYPRAEYSLYVKKSDQDELIKIFELNEYYYY